VGREPDGDPWEVAAAVAGVLEVIDTLTSLKVDLFMAGGTPLDGSYLTYGAALLGVTDLLERVLAQG